MSDLISYTTTSGFYNILITNPYSWFYLMERRHTTSEPVRLSKCILRSIARASGMAQWPRAAPAIRNYQSNQRCLKIAVIVPFYRKIIIVLCGKRQY